MEKQKWDNLYRDVTVEKAQIYVCFYETVILEKGRLSDAQKHLNSVGVLRNQSAITKILNQLSGSFYKDCGHNLVKKSSNGRWSEYKGARVLYELCLSILETKNEFERSAQEALKSPYIYIAFSTFGLPYVHRIKNSFVELYKGPYQLEYLNKRTRDIPHILLEVQSLDFAIGETLKSERENYDENYNANMDSEYHIESVIIGSEEIVVISNYEVGEGPLDDSVARSFPVRTVNQGVMLNYLAKLHGIELEEKRLDRHSISYLTDGGVTLIHPLHDNVHSLIDSFNLEDEKCVIFAGKNVADQIKTRNNYLFNSNTINRGINPAQIYEYEMKSGDGLDKRIFRRKIDEERFDPDHPYRYFWNAATRLSTDLA